ncbi:unnamed protein product [Phyllotreta striolata]|uniref:Beta-hexosaminidase n=1 Tax=Phyllotreta striolata TaxID=444603 RepID=A0A9N9TVG1_PHYSR|nr:unnamed protein product [Phyllotreta striolata]
MKCASVDESTESTESLLGDSGIARARGSGDRGLRNRREFVKMTGQLQCLLAFATLLSLIYGVQLAISDAAGYKVPLEEKLKVFRFNESDSDEVWTYDCSNKRCERRELRENERPLPLIECNMLCDTPSLWPKPKSVTVTERKLSTFAKNSVLTKLNAPKSVEKDLREALSIFANNLPHDQSENDVELDNISVNIKVTSDVRTIQLNTDESYKLAVSKKGNIVVADIVAPTYFGARHALETLSQLVIYDESSKNLKIYHDVEIVDKPAFPHRGLMVDTSRNFIPMKQLQRIVDGMAMNKLNVFHLHLTDDVSFPIVLPRNPWLAKYGAYSPSSTYFPDDIKGLIEHARIRGVRVILEIDAPSHANAGWSHGNTDKDQIIICGDEDVFNGHLNPDSKPAQNLLGSVYSDLLDLGTDNETFHIGGDEVNIDCLARTKSASNFSDTYDFWAHYVNDIFKTVQKAFRDKPPENIVIWSSPLTDRKIDSLSYAKNLIVQYWYGNLDSIVNNGNKVIVSTVGRWYLDCGFGSWKASQTRGVCDPYTPWQTFYDYRPWGDYRGRRQQFLGGEACLWTEQVGVHTVESRIWPRGAAFAERIWSDPPAKDLNDLVKRLADQSRRMLSRGFGVAAIWPEWCTLNPGKCM